MAEPAASPRVLLTSLGLRSEAAYRACGRLLRARRPSGNPRVLYVPDGAVGVGQDARSALRRVEQELSRLGIGGIVCAELRNTKRPSLEKMLKDVDCIYVDQGNTFYLRYYMHTSGFDELVPPLVKDGGVVYIGASSGSIVAGKTIETALWKGWDDPGYGTPWDLASIGYDGLDLLPGGKSVFPHYASKWKPLVERRRGELGRHAIVLIPDNGSYVVDGEEDEKPTTPDSEAGAPRKAPTTPRRPSPARGPPAPAPAAAPAPGCAAVGGPGRVLPKLDRKHFGPLTPPHTKVSSGHRGALMTL